MPSIPDVHHLLSLAGETVLVTGASGNIGRGVGALDRRDVDDGAAPLAPGARGSLRDEKRPVEIRA